MTTLSTNSRLTLSLGLTIIAMTAGVLWRLHAAAKEQALWQASIEYQIADIRVHMADQRWRSSDMAAWAEQLRLLNESLGLRVPTVEADK